MAHQLGAKKTVARVDNSEYVEEQNKELFRQMGVSDIYYPENPCSKGYYQWLEDVMGSPAMGCT